MMSDTLRQFVRSILSEITRYEEETGEKYDVKGEIKKLITKSHPVKYAFTMTDIPKVGLNPRTSFNTPAGVYAFQLNQAYYKKLVENKLPYVSNAPYCNIMKLNFGAGKWLITSKKGLDTASDADVELVKQKVGPDAVRRASIVGSHWSYGNDSKIFDLTYYATKGQPRSTVAWAKLLRELGYIGIYDPGNKVIHENEPMQLVCLDPRAYEWIETYETREIRKKELAPNIQKKSPTETPEGLRQWADDFDPKNPKTQSKDLFKAADILKGVLRSDPETLQIVFDKFPNQDKYSYVTRNPQASLEMLREVIAVILPKVKEQLKSENGYTGYSGYFANIYLHPNCPPEAWNFIDLFIKGNGIREVLSSPKIPVDAIVKLYNKMTGGKDLNNALSNMDYDVRINLKQLVKNPNLPQDILNDVLKSKDPSVRDEAMNNPNLPQEEYDNAVNSLLSPKTSKLDKHRISGDVRLKPEDAIKVIKTTNDEVMIRNILKNALFTANDLDALSRKYTRVIELAGIINNKNISLRTLRRLAQDPNANVRATAKSKVDQYKRYGPPV